MSARRHVGWWTLVLMVGALLVAPPAFADVGNVGAWGDQGDGTYRNPILPGDYQNTDVVQVGADYYYISSNKSFAPGMLVLHSTDLVNWEPIGHVLPDLTAMSPRYGHTVMTGETRGTWPGRSITTRVSSWSISPAPTRASMSARRPIRPGRGRR